MYCASAWKPNSRPRLRRHSRCATMNLWMASELRSSWVTRTTCSRIRHNIVDACNNFARVPLLSYTSSASFFLISVFLVTHYRGINWVRKRPSDHRLLMYDRVTSRADFSVKCSKRHPRWSKIFYSIYRFFPCFPSSKGGKSMVNCNYTSSTMRLRIISIVALEVFDASFALNITELCADPSI